MKGILFHKIVHITMEEGYLKELTLDNGVILRASVLTDMPTPIDEGYIEVIDEVV